jgi:DNA primase
MMMAWQFGYSNVCCTLGWAISQSQINKLNDASKVIAALDNDRAGKKGFKILKEGLKNSLIEFHYPKFRKDICDMTASEFSNSIMKCWTEGG